MYCGWGGERDYADAPLPLREVNTDVSWTELKCNESVKERQDYTLRVNER